MEAKEAYFLSINSKGIYLLKGPTLCAYTSDFPKWPKNDILSNTEQLE